MAKRPSKEKRRRDRIRKDKHRRNQPRKPPTGWRTQLRPEVLAHVGPVLRAQLAVPAIIDIELRRLGQPVPTPVAGVLLIDTGATRTCISQAAAERLGLIPTRIAEGYGAGGRHENPVYLVRFSIGFLDESTGLGQAFEWEQEVQGIPDLEKASEATGLKVDGQRTDYIGLLGRDVLRFSTFRYEGSTGKMSIDFDAALMQVEPLR